MPSRGYARERTRTEQERLTREAAEVDDLDDEVARKIFLKYRELDTNHDGMLGFEEMKQLLLKGNPNFSERQLKSLFKSISGPGAEKVNFVRFIRYVFAPPAGESDSRSRVRKMQAIARRQGNQVHQVEIFGASLCPELNGTYEDGHQEYNRLPVFDRADPPLCIFYGETEDGKKEGWFVARTLPKDGERVEKYLMYNPSVLAHSPELCCATWETPTRQRDKRMCLAAVDKEEWDDTCDEGTCLPEELFGDAEEEAEREKEELEANDGDYEREEQASDEDADWEAEWVEEAGENTDGQVSASGDEDTLDLFEDAEFPPDLNSLGGAEGSAGVDGWHRLSDINPEACLFKRVVPEDVVSQDRPSNAWFTAATASIAEYPGWVQSMFGGETTLSAACKYKVRLYHPGKKSFVNVIIDDYVPTYQGSPAFTGISAMGEIWPALLEKAFAKLNGSYKAIGWGNVAYGLLYLCGGGGAETWTRTDRGSWTHTATKWRGQALATINRRRAEGTFCDNCDIGQAMLWLMLRQYMELCYPVALGVDKSTARDSRLRLGLPYSVIGAREVPVQGKILRMVRIRNGFGATFFDGRWSDSSEAWAKCPVAVQKLRFTPKKGKTGDGTFWMAYSDFLRYFDRIDCVRKSMPIQGCRLSKMVGAKRGLTKFRTQDY